MFSVACSVGFASCKTFGKQPKHHCFGRSPKRGEGGSPTLSPGTDAGRVCPKALHDAEPTKHTQPFTRRRGLGIRQGCRDRTPKGFARTQSPQSVLKGIENLLYFIKQIFSQTVILYLPIQADYNTAYFICQEAD